MRALDAGTLVVLLVALPGLAVVQARALRSVHLPRMPAYASSAATIVVLGGWCSALSLARSGTVSLGLVSPPGGSVLTWTASITAASLGLLLGFRFLGNALGIPESDVLLGLLPATRGERLAFAGLSVVAGLGEEVVFRGYALPVLSGFTGVAGAAVATSVAFGVLHAYQGGFGVARTAAMGGVLAWGYLAAGSLWPVVLAHTVIDLLGGIFLPHQLMSPVRRDGVG
jgi:membrane protease YdiL (CAAX protease family)